MNNCKLILRLRDLNECRNETIRDIIKNFKNISISKNKNFYEDLAIADCLISYSSTAIEEAQFNRKKVSIIDFNNNNFLNFKDNHNKTSKLTKKNFDEKLNEIINEIKFDKKNKKKQITENYFFKNYENSIQVLSSLQKIYLNFNYE